MAFDTKAVSLCGVSVFGIEEVLDMDELSRDDFVQSYEDDPAAFWAQYELEYFSDSDYPTSEFVGVSLERAVSDLRDHTFNDVRMVVFNKLKEVGLRFKYKEIKWITFVWLEYVD